MFGEPKCGNQNSGPPPKSREKSEEEDFHSSISPLSPLGRLISGGKVGNQGASTFSPEKNSPWVAFPFQDVNSGNEKWFPEFFVSLCDNG